MTIVCNLDRFVAKVKTQIDAIKDFPGKAEAPVVEQLGLTERVVSIAITGQQSFDLPGGTIETSERWVSVRFAEQRRKVREFLDLIIIANANGSIVRLGEIATITD
jgi:multidrug efflux pump subunit AcrB